MCHLSICTITHCTLRNVRHVMFNVQNVMCSLQVVQTIDIFKLWWKKHLFIRFGDMYFFLNRFYILVYIICIECERY